MSWAALPLPTWLHVTLRMKTPHSWMWMTSLACGENFLLISLHSWTALMKPKYLNGFSVNRGEFAILWCRSSCQSTHSTKRLTHRLTGYVKLHGVCNRSGLCSMASPLPHSNNKAKHHPQTVHGAETVQITGTNEMVVEQLAVQIQIATWHERGRLQCV